MIAINEYMTIDEGRCKAYKRSSHTGGDFRSAIGVCWLRVVRLGSLDEDDLMSAELGLTNFAGETFLWAEADFEATIDFLGKFNMY